MHSYIPLQLCIPFVKYHHRKSPPDSAGSRTANLDILLQLIETANLRYKSDTCWLWNLYQITLLKRKRAQIKRRSLIYWKQRAELSENAAHVGKLAQATTCYVAESCRARRAARIHYHGPWVALCTQVPCLLFTCVYIRAREQYTLLIITYLNYLPKF